MTSVRLSKVSKRFGATTALDNVSLDIAAGEIFFILGPSGCGKSTLLRVIAGLLAPTGGTIAFNGSDVTSLATQDRNAVMCFQGYALWPHMTVRQNVGFGLSLRGLSSAEQEAQLLAVLKLVQLESLAERRPAQLSGGQQQRVALARALAVKPNCLLLDEPLSNLDARLRLEMRAEIRRVCKAAGSTTLYVTHDQKEALAVADRLAVLKDGRVMQTGTPAEVYERPRNSFVAAFLGQTNLIHGTVVGREGRILHVQTPLGLIHATAHDLSLTASVVISIRPARIRVAAGIQRVNRFSGSVVQTTFGGESSDHVVMINGQSLLFTSSPPLLDVPEDLTIEFDADSALALAR